MRYVDIHGHLNFTAYDPDRSEAITRARQAGVTMITVGTQYDTSKAARSLAQAHENIYAAVGLHPIHTSASHHDTAELGEGGREFTSRGEVPDIGAYRELARDPKVVAIGECGLDYYRLDDKTATTQRQVFESMIDLSNEVGKPLMLHLRSGSGRSAYGDALEILRSRAKLPGNLHFFAGSIEEAKPYLDLGYTFSFTGVVTFARNYDAVIRYLPLDRIMSETDCPFVAPRSHRGKRNEPSYIPEIVRAIAGIRGEGEESVAKQIWVTAQTRFNLV